MRKIYRLSALGLSVAVIGAAALGFALKNDFKGYRSPSATKRALAALAKRVLADVVYFEGGTFKMNNVPVPVFIDGSVIEAQIYGPIVDENRPETSVVGFYMSKYETTNHDFDLYAAAIDAPLRGDVMPPLRQGPYPANIPFEQAERYCAWLADLTGKPFTIPTSAQWEYAARSGGHAVAYATQDGAYDYLETLYEETLSDQPNLPHLPDAYPPNPSGLYAMSSNLGEWVKDAWFDSEEAEYLDHYQEGAKRVWRGSTYQSQASLNSIYMKGVSVRVKKDTRPRDPALYSHRRDPALFPEGVSQIYKAHGVGVRCAIDLDQPPTESGFGVAAGPLPPNFPTPITPRPRR